MPAVGAISTGILPHWGNQGATYHKHYLRCHNHLNDNAYDITYYILVSTTIDVCYVVYIYGTVYVVVLNDCDKNRVILSTIFSLPILLLLFSLPVKGLESVSFNAECCSTFITTVYSRFQCFLHFSEKSIVQYKQVLHPFYPYLE
jgi:hypothetical protein